MRVLLSNEVVEFNAEDDVSIFAQESSLSFECQRQV